jgi:hypothetical protein
VNILLKAIPVVIMLTIVAVVVTISIAVGKDIYTAGYARGQIDALTGNIHYVLITEPDSTKRWAEKTKD